MKIVYAFHKHGFEGEYWTSEIGGASDADCTFIPFNHDAYLPSREFGRAQSLDNLWFARDPRLLRMYDDLKSLLRESGADVFLADNGFPWHPEFLRKLSIYKVLRTSDGPLAAYDRDFAYLHAYDHVLFHSPAYSPDLDMREKLLYCGAKRADFWPLALFDAFFDPSITEDALFAKPREIDVVFVGALFPNKMPLLARVKQALGRRFRLHGLAGWKKNLYWNARFGFPGWVRPIRFEDYVPLYQRAKIGINVHNRGDYTVGGYRLFDLPGNGVMQISDGGEYLQAFYDVGREVIGHRGADDLIDKIRYYLAHEDERVAIARAGHRRVMRDHRFAHRMRQGAKLIEQGMQLGPSVR